MVPEKCCIHEQMKYFYNADIIVTPHGANCANLLFTKEGASMVECFGHMWVNPCMINTIALLETDYHMVCERLADYSKDAHKFSDYKINPLIMECTIKRIIERGKLIMGVADGKVFADGKHIYTAEDLQVGLIPPAK